MKDTFLKDLDFKIGIVVLGALFALIWFVSNIEIKDLDLWLHIAAGRYIVETHTIPHVDVLSNSFTGRPWINHEWLFQVIVYSLYNAFGPDGLIRMQQVIVIIMMTVLLYLGYSKDKQLITIFTLVLVFNVLQTRFTIRPELYSLLFFSFYILILALHIDKRWSTWALFIIQVIWSNMHGFFFFGPLFVLIALFSEWLKRSVTLPYEWNQTGRLADEEYGRLKWILGAVIVACLINPYFVHGAWYPLGVLFSLSGDNRIFFDFIQELQKPITLATAFSIYDFTFYKLLVFLSAVSFIFNRRRVDVSALFIWLVFLIFSVKAARNIAFFAFAAYLVIVTNMLSVSFRQLVPVRFTNKKFLYMTDIVAKLLLLMWLLQYSQMVSGRGVFNFDKYEVKSDFGGVSVRSYPERAVDFLVDNNIKGNFFNDFNSGAYLLGRAFPNIKVFIDGRTEVYGGAFFKQYQSIWEMGNPEKATEIFNKYRITGALLSSVKQTIPPAILQYFAVRKDWVLVYFDYDAMVYLKYTPANKPIIDRFAIDLTKHQVPKPDLFKLGAERDFPYPYYFRAFTLEGLNLDAQALEEAKAAIAIAPDYAEVYQLMGKIHAKKKDYQKAFENFRVAAMLAPQNKQMHYNLAQSYFDLNQYEAAKKEYEDIDARWPNAAKTLFLLAQTNAKLKKYDEAVKYLLKAHQLDKKDTQDILAVGDIVFDQRDYDQALKFYNLAFDTKLNLDNVHQKIGSVYEATGDLDQARAEYEKALAASPENKSVKEKLNNLK